MRCAPTLPSIALWVYTKRVLLWTNAGNYEDLRRDWMLVILTGDQILAPEQVCQSCLLADKSGQPRWRGGQLRCGQAISKLSEQQPEQYECMMGFRIAHIE